MTDGVIWHNDSVKSDNKMTDGVIWHNDNVKSDEQMTDGVIWHNDNVKSDEQMTDGVIWHNDKVNLKRQDVIWNSVTDIAHAQSAASDSNVSETSPQMKLIIKWTDYTNLKSVNIITLE
jgi:hypothetical protein